MARTIRFTLRSFLLATTCFGVATGLVADRVMYVSRVVRSVPVMEEQGISVLSDFHERYGLFPPPRRDSRANLIEWCLSNPDDICMVLNRTGGTDAIATTIAKLTSIKRLQMNHISPAGIRQLSRLPRLQLLQLESSAVDDNTLRFLADAPHLQTLIVVDAPLTDGGLPHFIGMPHLKCVRLHNTCVTRRGLNALRRARPDLDVEVLGDEVSRR